MRKHSRLVKLTLTLAFAALFFSGTAVAQTSAGAFFDPTKKIDLAGDKIEIEFKQGSARYLGNVVVRQGSSILRADLVAVAYHKDNQSSQGNDSEAGMWSVSGDKVKSLVASGRVVIKNGDRMATCQEAIYNDAARTITMTGSPKFSQGGSYLTGKKIVVHIDSEKVDVIGGRGQRVQGSISPSDLRNELDSDTRKRLDDLNRNPPPEPGGGAGKED